MLFIAGLPTLCQSDKIRMVCTPAVRPPYSPQDSSCCLHEVQRHVKTSHNGHACLLSVCDDGPNIGNASPCSTACMQNLAHN